MQGENATLHWLSMGPAVRRLAAPWASRFGITFANSLTIRIPKALRRPPPEGSFCYVMADAPWLPAKGRERPPGGPSEWQANDRPWTDSQALHAPVHSLRIRRTFAECHASVSGTEEIAKRTPHGRRQKSPCQISPPLSDLHPLRLCGQQSPLLPTATIPRFSPLRPPSAC
jgi:hypothetical protein